MRCRRVGANVSPMPECCHALVQALGTAPATNGAVSRCAATRLSAIEEAVKQPQKHRDQQCLRYLNHSLA